MRVQISLIMTNLSNSGNFLTDPDLYRENKLLWQNAVSMITDAEAVIQDDEANTPDGNPVFAAYYPALRKTVQVNQTIPGETETDFASSYEQIIYNEDAAEELVITLALTEDTFKAAISLISDFLSAESAPQAAPAEAQETDEADAGAETDEDTQLQALKLMAEAAEIKNRAYKARVEALEMVAEKLRLERNS